MFASIISWFKMCKKRAIKTGKAEDVTENDKKVILCNFLETTWNDNDCFLNILIGPKVADTTFTLKILIFLDQICPKKDIFGWKQKNEYHYCISHIQISLSTKFQLKLTILLFWTKFTQKGYFRLKTEKWTSPLYCAYSN